MYEHYILEDGENLDTICNNLHLDKKMIMELNHISSEDEVRSGRQIKVPVSDPSYYNTYTIERGDTIFMGNNGLCYIN